VATIGRVLEPVPASTGANECRLWGDSLQNAVTSGTVPQKRLDDMVTRILAGWYFVGQDKGYPSVTWSSWNGGKGGPNAQGDHKTVARSIARDGERSRLFFLPQANCGGCRRFCVGLVKSTCTDRYTESRYRASQEC
jgi:hypothetical protein